jgi:hypothetical protein
MRLSRSLIRRVQPLPLIGQGEQKRALFAHLAAHLSLFIQALEHQTLQKLKRRFGHEILRFG